MTFQDIFKSSFLESFSSFSLTDTLLSLAAAFLIGLFIYFVYRKTYSGVLYSRSFNVSLIAILLVTCLVIQGVTSNVVLSLGMVGALSIVRFRTAVKDPMDLVFLFWAIGEGILCGASLLPLAILGCPIIGIFLLVFSNRQQADSPYLLIIRMDSVEGEKTVTTFVQQVVKRMTLKSKTITGGQGTELIFEICPKNGESAFVALRTKGNNTLTSVASSDSDRYSFKIDFDYFNDGENYYGLKKLNLNNNYGDASYMREYISYRIMGEMGIPVPATSYTHITINGEEWGLYLAVEPIDEVFLERTFGDSTGDLYKPDGTGADLVYRGDDMSEYPGLVLKTNEETSDGSAILDLMKALESGEGLEDVLDVDEVPRYLAANVALANYDSYLGNTTHNYYLYEQDGRFTIVPWDYNYSFGGFGGGEVDIYEPTNQSMGMGGGRHPDMENGETKTAEGCRKAWNVRKIWAAAMKNRWWIHCFLRTPFLLSMKAIWRKSQKLISQKLI